MRRRVTAPAFTIQRKRTESWQSLSTNTSASTQTCSSARATCGAVFDVAALESTIAKLDLQATEPDFWNDRESAQRTLQQRHQLQKECDLSRSLGRKTDDLAVLIDWAKQGEDVAGNLTSALADLEHEVEASEIRKLLNGQHDQHNAIVSIHAGAGGTESHDWAEMLLRMYLRWTEQQGFSRRVIDQQPGDEAGMKAATITGSGDYAYGLLTAEAGIHRLVRISAFDRAAKRQTSFASVFVWPELPNDVETSPQENELRIDTFRSSGAGGQHVNVTDSAVRITHLPTGIVVCCQNERSQHSNRKSAMTVLRARLYDRRIETQHERLEQLGGDRKEITFGSQIRSYVLHPYRMVKDHRTEVQEPNVERVLNGDLNAFIQAELIRRASVGHATHVRE